ncbi:hypothetical protein [Collimonas fungivorans]|uniref:hypothetical protein n=1 Tax=Collimonas fungivorans TaxID=158899 RepID=UPI0011D21C68|nr:hypothetical protein [Collimonas fungivorans]
MPLNPAWTCFPTLMRRLLILLLMFLLPMQVFAGMTESQANTVATLAVQQEILHDGLQDAPACRVDSACDSEDIAVDDIEMHVDLGDETVPAFPLVFAAAAIASTPALSNDKALQPPFLPPAGPPPRA